MAVERKGGRTLKLGDLRAKKSFLSPIYAYALLILLNENRKLVTSQRFVKTDVLDSY
jgi:hypothetical protein